MTKLFHFTKNILLLVIFILVLDSCEGTAELPLMPGVNILRWTKPTENVDQTILTDLTGFIIYYGTSPDNMKNTFRIDNADIRIYKIDNIVIDIDLISNVEYYFSIKSINSKNIQSDYSNIISLKYY